MYKIVILPGDGIGKEVCQWGQKVLEAIGKAYDLDFAFEEGLIGHSAIEKTGNPLPDETLQQCHAADAVLLGAVGHPMYDNDPSKKVRPEQGLLKIRKELGLYANLRPIRIFDELMGASSLRQEILKGADILFFRELTGGIPVDRALSRQRTRQIAEQRHAGERIDSLRLSQSAMARWRGRL